MKSLTLSVVPHYVTPNNEHLQKPHQESLSDVVENAEAYKMAIIGVLISRLGGKVTITPEEISDRLSDKAFYYTAEY